MAIERDRELVIDDAEWFELQFAPERAKADYGIDLPGFPNDATQISFTGMCGRPNLQQAFSFYLAALAISGVGKIDEPRILDFGAGWGRIARFFLREARPKDIVAADTMKLAIDCLRQTGGIFQIVHNLPVPPFPDLRQTFHLIYAYSVFSHLSETYARAWLDYLLTLLKPGGSLIVTTRGERFISHLATIKAQSTTALTADQNAAGVGEYLRKLRDNFPDPETIRQRFAAGQFQFYPVGQHEPDCNGETLIPRSYFETHYRPYLADFSEDVPAFDQSVVVLKSR
jgi:2-polyprenyl-3-methyl-5-hydroxy-6-metoxy-1,4-benzoquinol methylase